MKTYVFEGEITALSSISHNGGQSVGVNSLLRREKFVQPDATVEEVPVISGNSIRGILRDVGMRHFCRALGYGENGAGLSLAAFHFLFSGGALTKDKTRGLDETGARALRELIPLVGLFGGAMGNKILPGKLKIGKAIPICAETLHLLPAPYCNVNPVSIWDYLQEEMYTRTDDAKNEHLQALIAPRVRTLLLDAARAKSEKEDAGKPQDDTGQHQQMRYYVETFAAGTQFYWKVVLDDPTEVEFEAFITTLVEFSKLPYLGGKSGTGLGEVAITFAKWLEIDSRVVAAQASDMAVDMVLGTKYMAHLQARAGEIRAVLEAIQ